MVSGNMLDKKAINLSLDMPEIYPTTFKKLSQKLFNAECKREQIYGKDEFTKYKKQVRDCLLKTYNLSTTVVEDLMKDPDSY